MRRDINIIMKISIIVPVYNAEKTIEYCIDSIITQKTKFEIELILVEDYSTDRSYEICLALKKKYTEIKLYRTNGKGVSAARNTGLSHSTGDVVGFCDSDDIYEKDVFEKVRLFFENKDIDIVSSMFLIRTGRSCPLPTVSILAVLWITSPVVTATWAT